VPGNLPTILRNIRFCKADIMAFQPDAVVFIDYPGFNLRIAGWAKRAGYRTIYYISPQVWAWKESRVRSIRDCIDKMLVILPFEQAFYKKWHYEVEYVGHPLVEVIDRFKDSPAAQVPPDIIYTPQHRPGSPKPIIALLPGSRRQEILKKLPVMLEAGRSFPGHQLVVAEAPGVDDAFYDGILKDHPEAGRVRNQTYALLNQAKAACVTSGTATLETALFGVPEVVCYKGSPVSYQIAKRLIKVKYISLVNLIMDKPVVKELIQDEMTSVNIAAELKKLLTDPAAISRIKEDYAALKTLLGQGGDAAEKAAESIVAFLR
jgi:lipid-A-disaccharide synthase